jgi:hypothetical protein
MVILHARTGFFQARRVEDAIFRKAAAGSSWAISQSLFLALPSDKRNKDD